MAVQIRIYTINRGELHSFVAEWQEKIKPLRLKVGFQIPGAWEIEATNQFIWLMSYDGPDEWESRDRAYFESDERRAMQPDPARHIARIEQYFVDPVG